MDYTSVMVIQRVSYLTHSLPMKVEMFAIAPGVFIIIQVDVSNLEETRATASKARGIKVDRASVMVV